MRLVIDRVSKVHRGGARALAGFSLDLGPGVLGLLGSQFKHSLGPLMPGLYLTPYPDCYRCPFKMTYPACDFHCLDFAREMIKLETTNATGALMARFAVAALDAE